MSGTITVTSKQHSPIGASSCERWWNCPGSISLSEAVPRQAQSTYAAEGTAAHELCDHLVSIGYFAVPDDMVGTTITVGDDTFTVTDEMVDAVQIYLDTIAEDATKYSVAPKNIHSEKTFHLKQIHPEAFGTCDALIFAPLKGPIIYDFKYGKGVEVNAENNKQGLYYALGAFNSLTDHQRALTDEIEIVIVQPRINPEPSRWRVSVADLLIFSGELSEAVDRVYTKDPTLFAGSWCRFCPAKPICPEMAKGVAEELAMDLADLFGGTPVLPNPANLSPEEMSKLLTSARIIQEWCASVQKFAHFKAEEGVEIPGYKLVEGRANRKWIDKEAVVGKFHDEFGQELFTEPALKSPAQVEKLLGKKRIGELEGLWEKPPGRNTLVPEHDDRPTKKSEVESLFSEIVVE